MLAVVVMGLILNHERNCISVEVQHFLHHFFEMIAYLLNTIIFLIAGIRLGDFLVGTVGGADDGISNVDCEPPPSNLGSRPRACAPQGVG